MIQTGVENLISEFIVRSYLASGVVTGSYSQSESLLSFVDALAGQSIAIRPGETIEGQTMPAVHVICDAGEEDDIRNQTVTVTVAIVFPCDPDTQVPDNLARLNVETERLIGWLFNDDLGEQAAALCTSSLGTSIIGVPSRGSRRSFDGHLAIHELTLTLYCAGLNLY
jgi:hypothetical protein